MSTVVLTASIEKKRSDHALKACKSMFRYLIIKQAYSYMNRCIFYRYVFILCHLNLKPEVYTFNFGGQCFGSWEKLCDLDISGVE